MKRYMMRLTFLSFILLLSAAFTTLWAQVEPEEQIVITGIVKNKETRKRLENATVSLVDSNIGTVTNADGFFSLKLKARDFPGALEVSHMGFLSTRIPLAQNAKTKGLEIWMLPAPNMLNEVVVFGNNARALVEEAIKKIPQNYASNNNMLTGFYRETVQKGRRYIAISEAIIDIYKTTYANPEVGSDRVRIAKGRRLLSPKTSDTLAVKVLGGPNLSLYLDVVKNRDFLLGEKTMEYYEYAMDTPVSLNERLQYVVNFYPVVNLPYALFYGKLYIDYETLSFTRAEFMLDMSDRLKAIEAILYRKPLGLRFRPQEVSYIVTYKEIAGKTHLSYIRNSIRFKCDWKRKLFSSGYTAFSEMVVTDHVPQNVNIIPGKESFKQRDVFYDKVDEYWHEDFWKAYNIIEPTESLEDAVNKLKRQAE